MIVAAIAVVTALIIFAKIIAALALIGLALRAPFEVWNMCKYKLYGGTKFEKYGMIILSAWLGLGGLYVLIS